MSYLFIFKNNTVNASHITFLFILGLIEGGVNKRMIKSKIKNKIKGKMNLINYFNNLLK